MVYPAYSRRSGGLSLGIDLFSDGKHCPFDCPYCEVFPFAGGGVFSVEAMEHDLRNAVAAAAQRGEPVRDICFSGSGEPSVSPHFTAALKAAVKLRGAIAPSVPLVVITNGAGLFDRQVFSALQAAALTPPLPPDIWLKVDAGTPDWYRKINNADIPHERLVSKLKDFVAAAPVTVQSMMCAVDGEEPPPEEAAAWQELVVSLAATGNVGKVQVYGKARPAPADPKAAALSPGYLERRAASLRLAFTGAGLAVVPVEVYF